MIGRKKETVFSESPEDRDRRMAWWRDARFGMFIHWGLYAIPGGRWNWRRSRFFPSEWIMCEMMIPDRKYSSLANDFNPVKFDAAQWVSIAKDAGMKYLVLTSKHHEGFCLFDTQTTDYNSYAGTPFGRDIVGELAEACADAGLKFGLYYSQLDWHIAPLPVSVPLYPRFAKYLYYMKRHLEELLTNYGPISVLFFDGDWMPQWLLNPEVGQEVEAFCRELQPDIVINNRVGTRSILSILPQFQRFTQDTTGGDYETPEQFVMEFVPGRDWETCMTMNDNWGWCAHDNNWKSTEELVWSLADVVSKGGNFLLNVGPTPDGLIPQPSVERLEKIGEWMRENGQAIYGAGLCPGKQSKKNLRFTQTKDRVYEIARTRKGAMPFARLG